MCFVPCFTKRLSLFRASLYFLMGQNLEKVARHPEKKMLKRLWMNLLIFRRSNLLDGRGQDDGIGRPLHATAHQIGEVAALRFNQRFSGHDFCELHQRERTLSEVRIPNQRSPTK